MVIAINVRKIKEAKKNIELKNNKNSKNNKAKGYILIFNQQEIECTHKNYAASADKKGMDKMLNALNYFNKSTYSNCYRMTIHSNNRFNHLDNHNNKQLNLHQNN